MTPPSQNQAAPNQFRLADVYYALFSHRWKVFFCWVLGISAAVLIYRYLPPSYVSEARLLVKYVVNSRPAEVVGQGDQLQSPDARGSAIMNSEVQILTSMDLATNVAQAVGPAAILGKTNASPADVYRAAQAIESGLTVEAPRNSATISISYKNRNPAVVQPVVRQLISAYLQKHMEIHRDTGQLSQFLSQEADGLRASLASTVSQLKQLQQNVGVGSWAALQEREQLLNQQIRDYSKQYLDAESLLAQQSVMVGAMTTAAPAVVKAPTNSVAATSPAPLSPDLVSQYRAVCDNLRQARAREANLLTKFTEKSELVQAVKTRVHELEASQHELELQEPRLAMLSLGTGGVHSTGGAGAGSTSAATDPSAILATVAGLRARIHFLTNGLQQAQTKLLALQNVEPQMQNLERQRSVLETNLYAYSTSQEQVRLSSVMSSDQTPNISVVEAATAPMLAKSKKLKLAGGALAGGLLGGPLLAWLLTFYLSQTLKRPMDVERNLRLPLVAFIPDFTRNGYAKAWKQLTRPPRPTKANRGKPVKPNYPLAGWTGEGPQLYWEAVRDRLVLYFELRNLTHKPKLVGLTSCSRRAGVSALAAGLARSFSETGDGKVLLVDMNPAAGPQVYPFQAGHPQGSLNDALEDEQRDTARVDENLYAVTVRETNSGRVGVVPRRFASLVPRLKASDYDYIIFDMPPVSQTSPTSKIAGLMDITLLVVESEKTNVEIAKGAKALLGECNANVMAVLNKYKPRLPKRLQTDV